MNGGGFMSALCARCGLGLTLADSWPFVCKCPLPWLKPCEHECSPCSECLEAAQ